MRARYVFVAAVLMMLVLHLRHNGHVHKSVLVATTPSLMIRMHHFMLLVNVFVLLDSIWCTTLALVVQQGVQLAVNDSSASTHHRG